MTPEQCHANHYHSQQVEGSAGWDRHSSGDLRNQQMDDQDEENRRIYNQGDFTKRGTIRKRPGSFIGGVSRKEKKKSFSAEDQGRALTFPPTTLLTIQLPNDPARLLKASSQRPSSQVRFSTKFIVLGLLGLGLLTSTMKGTPLIGTLQKLMILKIFYCVMSKLLLLNFNILKIFFTYF